MARNNTYTVLVNLEGNITPSLVRVGYQEAHDYAARLAADGMGVDIIQHSFRPGIPDCRCCTSWRGELRDCT